MKWICRQVQIAAPSSNTCFCCKDLWLKRSTISSAGAGIRSARRFSQEIWWLRGVRMRQVWTTCSVCQIHLSFQRCLYMFLIKFTTVGTLSCQRKLAPELSRIAHASPVRCTTLVRGTEIMMLDVCCSLTFWSWAMSALPYCRFWWTLEMFVVDWWHTLVQVASCMSFLSNNDGPVA